MGYIEILFLLHIAGAIIGFGPTFGFAILGPLSGKLGGPQALGLLKGMVGISKALIIPVAVVVQPVTGVLLIFETGRNQNFFQHEWLWIALLLYVFMFYTAVFVQKPNVEKMIELAEAGEAQSEAFQALAEKTKKMGPLLNVALLIIIFLMITKPGAPEGFF